MTFIDYFASFHFPKTLKKPNLEHKGKGWKFPFWKRILKKAEAGSYAVVNCETNLINFLIFFQLFPKQPNASKFSNVKHLETEFVFVLVHKGLQKLGAFDKFRLST